MNDDEKKCPFCAEVIKAEAKICRFCNRDLEDNAEEEAEEVGEVKARSGIMDGVKIGCGMFIVLPLLLLFGVIAFLLGIGSCGAAIKQSSATKKNSPSTAKPSPKRPSVTDFEIVSSRGEWQNERLRVLGEIRNKGAVPAGVQIEAIARDSKGVLIESKQFWPNSTSNIAPGQTAGIGYTVTKDPRAKSVEVKIIEVQIW